uniref:CDGSH iron-sulfur domain-containing protein 3, mitochondrial n=1 Tax=Rhabditophanes sp. KR3021 TaxID=114890 RepID=A0AC35TRA0_9BILA
MATRSLAVLFRSASNKIKILNPSADMLPINGVVAGHKSIKVTLETGKTYNWCGCGLSKNQPWCDNTHKTPGFTTSRPIQFQVEKTGEYSMCACKQTSKRPLCDGTHKDVVKIPKNVNASTSVIFADSPVYDGVARKLGYKQRDGGFQK